MRTRLAPAGLSWRLACRQPGWRDTPVCSLRPSRHCLPLSEKPNQQLTWCSPLCVPAVAAMSTGKLRFLTLVKPVLHVLPEVAQPDRKIPFKVRAASASSWHALAASAAAALNGGGSSRARP